MLSKKTNYKRIYVWELPVRFFHWVNALSIVILAITGYLIASPPGILSSKEASELYWFGTIRFIHFATAYIFFFNFIFRLYWGFVGNRYAKWTNFIPYTKRYLSELWEMLKVDIFQKDLKPDYLCVGHNPLAGFTYFLIFLTFLFQSVSGFALYTSMSDSFFPRLFHWIVPLMGGDFAVRKYHHLAMWFFIVFSIIHVYLVFYHDYIEGRGTTSSMIGGWKFESEERLEIEGVESE